LCGTKNLCELSYRPTSTEFVGRVGLEPTTQGL
jgi:hypothetical protein